MGGLKNRLRDFYSFNILKLSIALLFVALTFIALSPVFSAIKIVPCYSLKHGSTLCALNPASEPGTVYFFYKWLDYAYSFVYLVFMALIIPYSFGCFVFKLYYKHIKKLMR